MRSLLLIGQRCNIQSQSARCIRLYSTATKAAATAATTPPKDKRLIYATPNAGLVKLAKAFSLSTLGVNIYIFYI